MQGTCQLPIGIFSWVGMNQVFKIGDFKSIRCHRDVKFRYRAWNWPSQLLRKRNLVDPSSKYNLRKTGHWCHHCPIQIFDGGHFQQFMNERKQIYEWAWRHTWRLPLWRGDDVATTYRHPGLRSGNDGIRQDGLTLAHPCYSWRSMIWCKCKPKNAGKQKLVTIMMKQCHHQGIITTLPLSV